MMPLVKIGDGPPSGRFSPARRDAGVASPSLVVREKRPGLRNYAAFFSPDNAPRIFFTHAEKRWRFCSRRTTASLVTQLNWITRRGPEHGLWPCHALLLRRNASSLPSGGGTSRITASRLVPERSNRSRPPDDSHPAFI